MQSDANRLHSLYYTTLAMPSLNTFEGNHQLIRHIDLCHQRVLQQFGLVHEVLEQRALT